MFIRNPCDGQTSTLIKRREALGLDAVFYFTRCVDALHRAQRLALDSVFTGFQNLWPWALLAEDVVWIA